MKKLEYELSGTNSSEQLIFPNKIQAKGNVKRISEQELRLLFIEELKKSDSDIFYSIEMPTERKYKFGDTYKEIECDDKAGQSALIDMCVFAYKDKGYHRLLNIEFKHKNTEIRNIAKDVVKLICERQNGALIHLIANTNRGTLCNHNKTGVLDKLYKPFFDFKENWNNEDKYILIAILSLKEQMLIYRKICREDLLVLKEIFFADCGCGNIKEIRGMDWNIT